VSAAPVFCTLPPGPAIRSGFMSFSGVSELNSRPTMGLRRPGDAATPKARPACAAASRRVLACAGVGQPLSAYAEDRSGLAAIDTAMAAATAATAIPAIEDFLE